MNKDVIYIDVEDDITAIIKLWLLFPLSESEYYRVQ
jgi:hypothetical protein